jgi:hypothetical protein
LFNTPKSEFFIYMLSTRAGGVGINLATADTGEYSCFSLADGHLLSAGITLQSSSSTPTGIHIVSTGDFVIPSCIMLTML